MSWFNVLAVFLGSGLGGVCRYLAGKAIQANAGFTLFPWGTFAVNVCGCFLIGLVYGLCEHYAATHPGDKLISSQIRLLLTVGFCGGFTTFSTFINENYLLFKSSNILLVIVYMAMSVSVGLALLYVGYLLANL